MSDIWDFDHKQEQNQGEPEAAPKETPVAETDTQEPAQAPAAQPPAQPPLNGWSSDGSYRYVPPHTEQPVAPQPPVQPPASPYQPPAYGSRYQSPAGGYTGWTPPAGGSTPPAGVPQPPRKNRGWVVAVALLGAAAVITCLVMVVFAAMQGIDVTPENSRPSTDASSTVVEGEENSESGGLGENAPSLGIGAWDEDDGGLNKQEIVNRNYDSTVSLVSYTQTSNFYFGESTLTEAGAATGIIMSEDGYIITNWHCVINENTGEPYDRIDVVTYDGTVYEEARVIGADEATDLAVIDIDASGLAVAQFGDSAELSVGSGIVALGNAAGLGGELSATFGYVSALARDVYEDTGYAIRCLQVDAAINPGNSGGPLLNNQGLVVGINSAKIAATGYEGLGFSIPINEAKPIIDSLLKYGYVKGRVALGITGQSISSGMYKGFMIATIDPESSLHGTTVRAGDLIVAVDDATVEDYGTLRAELAKHQVGDRVTLKLLRSDQRTGEVSSFTVTVELKEQRDR